MDDVKIYPLGESAVIADFGGGISVETNRRVIAFADKLNSSPFRGLIEAVASYSSAAVYYDLATIRSNAPPFRTAVGAIERILREVLGEIPQGTTYERPIIEIPVSFAHEHGLDLEAVAASCSLSAGDVVEIFTSRTYRVFMIGFVPGFAYMGSVDERIRVPRRHTPRTRVPKGSVAIAGEQCGVYPFETPGGWNILGQSNIELFRPDDGQPSLLKAGDLVTFAAK